MLFHRQLQMIAEIRFCSGLHLKLRISVLNYNEALPKKFPQFQLLFYIIIIVKFEQLSSKLKIESIKEKFFIFQNRDFYKIYLIFRYINFFFIKQNKYYYFKE